MKILFALPLALSLCGCVSTHYGARSIPGQTTTVTILPGGVRLYWHEPTDPGEREAIAAGLAEIEAAVKEMP